MILMGPMQPEMFYDAVIQRRKPVIIAPQKSTSNCFRFFSGYGLLCLVWVSLLLFSCLTFKS